MTPTFCLVTMKLNFRIPTSTDDKHAKELHDYILSMKQFISDDMTAMMDAVTGGEIVTVELD